MEILLINDNVTNKGLRRMRVVLRYDHIYHPFTPNIMIQETEKYEGWQLLVKEAEEEGCSYKDYGYFPDPESVKKHLIKTTSLKRTS